MFKGKIYKDKKTGKWKISDGTEIKDGKVKVSGKEYFVILDA